MPEIISQRRPCHRPRQPQRLLRSVSQRSPTCTPCRTPELHSHKNRLSGPFRHGACLCGSQATRCDQLGGFENPLAYVNSNMVGFAHVLEGCRHNAVEHLVYASSSSVYGANTTMPFSVHDNVDHPLSLYAASKKANELMAHTYSHLYGLPTTGLRFFTVYGPWDRPDMALQKFTRAILSGKKIQVFNYGKHRRDFTYIDDIVEGVVRVLDKPATSNPEWSGNHPDAGSSIAPWLIFNIGNNNPVDLMDYIEALENALGKKAEKIFLPLQPGDVPDTYADVNDLVEQFNYKPSTTVDEGIAQFTRWYLEYYES